MIIVSLPRDFDRSVHDDFIRSLFGEPVAAVA